MSWAENVARQAEKRTGTELRDLIAELHALLAKRAHALIESTKGKG